MGATARIPPMSKEHMRCCTLQAPPYCGGFSPIGSGITGQSMSHIFLATVICLQMSNYSIPYV